MAADERLGFELETISTSELFGELKSQLVGLPQASVYITASSFGWIGAFVA